LRRLGAAELFESVSMPPRKQLPADVGSPETFEVFGKSRCLRRPAESPCIGGADEAVGRHPQTTGFAVLEDDIFHGQADRPAAEAEDGAHHLGDFLERVVAVLCKEERPSRSLLYHEKVEVETTGSIPRPSSNGIFPSDRTSPLTWWPVATSLSTIE